MTCWYEGPLAAFDTETTGVDVESDRIVSAAIVVQDAAGSRPRVSRWLVNPGVPVPAGATEVHGLTDEHLQRNGRWPAPVMEEIARLLGEQAAAGRPLVVMNAPFDLTLLDRELRRHRASALGRYMESSSAVRPRSARPRQTPGPLPQGPPHPRRTCARTTRWSWRARTTRPPTHRPSLDVVRAVGRRFASRWSGCPPPNCTPFRRSGTPRRRVGCRRGSRAAAIRRRWIRRGRCARNCGRPPESCPSGLGPGAQKSRSVC